jgi:hypothetical protein
VVILESTKKTSKRKFLTPMSNLPWLRAAVKKFNSGANVPGIWREANQKSYRILSHLSNSFCTPWYNQRFRSYAILKSTRLLEFLCGAKLSNLEKPELLTPNPIQSQETSNNSIVYNVLRFLTVTHIPQSDSRLRSYDLWELLVATGNSGLDWMKWLG